MSQTPDTANAIRIFQAAWALLNQHWDASLDNDHYPFSTSFDEIDVETWLEAALEEGER